MASWRTGGCVGMGLLIAGAAQGGDLATATRLATGEWQVTVPYLTFEGSAWQGTLRGADLAGLNLVPESVAPLPTNRRAEGLALLRSGTPWRLELALAEYLSAAGRETYRAVLTSDDLNHFALNLEESAPLGRWQPAPGGAWQIQLDGEIDTTPPVELFDIDLFDTPASLISERHAAGQRVICYFSAGSFEQWRPDAADFPALVQGQPLAGWPGEWWLDIRQIDLLAPVMEARLDLAVSKGCDAVDTDNVDGFDNDTGFPLSAEDQLNYNLWLAYQAQRRGLAIGLKNDLSQVAELVEQYDFAVNEQCIEQQNCDLLRPFVTAGKAVFNIEYSGDPTTVCQQAQAFGLDTLIKQLTLDAWRYACHSP